MDVWSSKSNNLTLDRLNNDPIVKRIMKQKIPVEIRASKSLIHDLVRYNSKYQHDIDAFDDYGFGSFRGILVSFDDNILVGYKVIYNDKSEKKSIIYLERNSSPQK